MDTEIQKIDAEHRPENDTPLADRHALHLGHLLKVEKEYIAARRELKGQNTELSEDSFGIALSGGGIRSATLSLGVVEEFNKVNLIEQADYLSSVSGGGYLASYIHTALNKSEPTPYHQLFDKDKVIKHLRDFRMHLFLWPNLKWPSRFVLLIVAVTSFVLNWLWVILPVCYAVFYDLTSWSSYGVLLLLILIPSFFLSPNFTSLHRYYKNRLRKAYLWLDEKILLKDLSHSNSPYPLINATVNVDKDDYSEAESVSYRGRINSNYFLFSPLYCGSQVTHYTRTAKSLYSKVSLATAMATSAAAVNTFMGNMNLPAPVRWFMILANWRTGFLAPSPFLKNWFPVFWPSYTVLEILGKAKTTSYKIQVSDGGHIENLAIYELLRRQVKTIIAVDGGQDDEFDFFDLRNLIIRARNELGMVIEFSENSNPLDTVKPSPISGTSKSHFSIARISGLAGSYAENYEGILIYIKSSVLPITEFKLRSLKKEVERLKKNGELDEFERKRRELDHTMYRTYTPAFPHQSTADQFFSEEQWDAYYHLGRAIGNKVIRELGIQATDSRLDLHRRCIDWIKTN